MSDGDDEGRRTVRAVDEAVREATEHEAPCAVDVGRPSLRMVSDQRDRMLEFLRNASSAAALLER